MIKWQRRDFNQRSMPREAEFQVNKDLVRKRLLKYTRKASRMLPQIDRPRIPDIGCGFGVSTMELARLSRGQVIPTPSNSRNFLTTDALLALFLQICSASPS